jgi:hypothetical protein
MCGQYFDVCHYSNLLSFIHLVADVAVVTLHLVAVESLTKQCCCVKETVSVCRELCFGGIQDVQSSMDQTMES